MIFTVAIFIHNAFVIHKLSSAVTNYLNEIKLHHNFIMQSVNRNWT